MLLRRVELDLLAGEPFWEVVQAPAGRPPEIASLTPTSDASVDGADRVSLVLQPDSEVRFRIPDLPGPLFLCTAAGVDLSLARKLARAGMPPLTLDFELYLDDGLVFQESITTHPKLATELVTKSGFVHRWIPVGSDGQLAVEPGQVVRLRTSLAPGADASSLKRIRAGFADMLLVRSEQRSRERASAEHPNVVLIVMDTLRADRTTLHGERMTTPNLMRLAESGLTFDRAYASSSWTWPSVSSLLTGLEPSEHGVVSNKACFLSHELQTLAEALQEGGWTTATFSGNPLISPWRNFDQGVEQFDHSREIRQSRDVVPQGLQWMEERRDTRFFVHFQLMDPHSPHVPRAQDMQRFCGTSQSDVDPALLNAVGKVLRRNQEHTADGQPRTQHLVSEDQMSWLSDVYDASVATGDYWVGQILDKVEALGLGERTLIVFTSDHGEELFDHGLLEHAHTLFEELIHVPLVVKGPGVAIGSVQGSVTNRMLGPTIAQRVGAHLPGETLRLEPGQVEARTLFFDTHKGWWNGREFVRVLGVRRDDWVLHYSPDAIPWGAPAGTSPGIGEMRLYQLADDPDQLRDRALQEPARAQAMRDLILDHQRELSSRAPKRRAQEAGDSMLEVLRGMGYAGDE
ncbi:MAG: arylsulfatase A-like enzyme [Chlamydiales bacterium]|jgi:arylsulfatase A-like enzyme